MRPRAGGSELEPASEAVALHPPIRSLCFDWGGTLMADDGPDGVPMSRWPEVSVIPGARECLAELHGRVQLCVATNAAQSSQTMIEEALARVDLLRYLSKIFCFSDIGARKNSPEFWLVVGRRLDVPLDQIVVVGDSLEHDVVAPRRFGLQVVWFNRRGENPEPRVSVPTVTELDQLSGLVGNVL